MHDGARTMNFGVCSLIHAKRERKKSELFTTINMELWTVFLLHYRRMGSPQQFDI